MRPQKIGYKYAKIISVYESTDMIIPSGGSGKFFKRTHMVLPGAMDHCRTQEWWRRQLLCIYPFHVVG